MLNFLTVQLAPHILLVHHSIFCVLISWSRFEWKSLESKNAPGVLIFLTVLKQVTRAPVLCCQGVRLPTSLPSDQSPRSPLVRSQAARVSPFQPCTALEDTVENMSVEERATGQNDSKSTGLHHTQNLPTPNVHFPPETAFLGGRLPQLLFQRKSPGLRRGPENAWARL